MPNTGQKVKTGFGKPGKGLRTALSGPKDLVVVVASGELPSKQPLRQVLGQADLVVAADGGLLHLAKLGVRPDVLIGDLDSLNGSPPEDFPVLPSPREKDATDLELALDFVAELNPREVHIFAALGGRLDHALGTIQVLSRYAFPIVLHHKPETLYLVQKRGEIPAQVGDLVSLIPLTARAQGITTQGLRYALKGGTLKREATRGISNEVTSLPCLVEVRSGKLLVVHTPQQKRR